MTKKMRMTVKNRIRRYYVNRPRPRHGRKHTKYKNCLVIIMVICVKQHRSSIRSSIHNEFKQHELS